VNKRLLQDLAIAFALFLVAPPLFVLAFRAVTESMLGFRWDQDGTAFLACLAYILAAMWVGVCFEDERESGRYSSKGAGK